MCKLYIAILNPEPLRARCFERDKQDPRQLLRSRGSVAFNLCAKRRHFHTNQIGLL